MCGLPIISITSVCMTFLGESLPAKEVKGISCSRCGRPIWKITKKDSDEVEWRCMNAHLCDAEGLATE
jgi:hypothetical protein